jgi:hypothetical protein
MREARGRRERSEVTGVGPAASSRIQAMMDQEGTGVDLDLDAFEREELRTEARGRPEAGEKGAARTRGEVTGVEPEPAASSRSRIQAATVDGSRAWMRRPGEAVGKVGGGTGNPSRRTLYMPICGQRWPLVGWAPRLPVPARAGRVIWPVPVSCHGPGRRPKHGTGPVLCQHGHGGLRAVPAHGPCQMSGLRAVPATHGLDGNL